MKHRMRWVSAGAALALAGAPMALAANPATAPSSDGNIFVSINSIGGTAASPTISGYAGIDRACDEGAACGIVVDVSRSTRRPNQQRSNPNEIQDCNGDGAINFKDDANGDGKYGGTLDCEILGLLNWNNSNQPFAKPDLALVIFGDTGATADVSGAPGQQNFVKPNADDNVNGNSDFNDAVSSLRIEGIGKHTAKTVGGTTKLNEGLRELERVMATRPSTDTKEGVLISDGFSQQALDESVLSRLANANIPVDTFAMPGDASVDDQDSVPNGCATGSHLQRIAAATGGTCTQISDSNLLIGALLGKPVQRVDVKVGTGPSRQASYNAATRRWTIDASAAELCAATDANPIAATATAPGGGTATATVGPNDEPLKSWLAQSPTPCAVATLLIVNPAVLSLLPGAGGTSFTSQNGSALVPVAPLADLYLQRSARLVVDKDGDGAVDENEIGDQAIPVIGRPVTLSTSGALDPVVDGLEPLVGNRSCVGITDDQGYAVCNVSGAAPAPVLDALSPTADLDLNTHGEFAGDAKYKPSSDDSGVIQIADNGVVDGGLT